MTIIIIIRRRIMMIEKVEDEDATFFPPQLCADISHQQTDSLSVRVCGVFRFHLWFVKLNSVTVADANS